MRLPAKLGLCLALIGCAQAPTNAIVPSTALPFRLEEPSRKSLETRAYYQSKERFYTSQSYLRTDGGGPDTPYSAQDLARNFERIAFQSEFTQSRSGFLAKPSRRSISRWQKPVRVMMHFGPSVSNAVVRKDKAQVRHYLQRLSRLARHPIGMTENTREANYHIYVVSVDEQKQLGRVFAYQNIVLDDSALKGILAQDRSTYCYVFSTASHTRPNVYEQAIAVVRSEHPDLSRLACYHEEIIQGLGLHNDSEWARPSIFNDDNEFALLTAQDEDLLQMLYDPRLQPGMTQERARPIIAQIARDVIGTNR